MNVIGKIYKTLNISKLKNGFNIDLKIKSNFGGVKDSSLTALKDTSEIKIELNEKLILDKECFKKTNKNEIKFNINKSNINLKKEDLVKPDAYNLKLRKISLENKKNKGIEVPIIIGNDIHNIKMSILELTPCIHENEDYIKIKIKGDNLPIKICTNDEVILM